MLSVWCPVGGCLAAVPAEGGGGNDADGPRAVGRVSLGDTAKRGTAAVPETFLSREAESQPQEMYHTHWTRADDVDDEVD